MKSLLFLVMLIPGGTMTATANTPETFEVKSPFDDLDQQAQCPLRSHGAERQFEAIELMKTDAETAAACGRFLDETFPEWEHSDEAAQLVEIILAYFLGNGVDRGMWRHDDFISLLWHLQRIAPDWRLRDEVDAILEEAIIQSTAQDPFVAEFWRDAIDEGHIGWQESAEARSALPEIYERAVVQQQRTDGLSNDRPRELLKELSWPSYAKLIMETRVIDSWPKRIVIGALILFLLILIVRVMRRKSHA